MALAIEILLAAAVLAGLGLAAAGRLDGMSHAVPDAPAGLPPGPVTPEGLRGVLLPVVLRGYRMADVDDLLERAAQQLEQAPDDGDPQLTFAQHNEPAATGDVADD